MGARGPFVTLEGIDGCGKSTKATLLRDALAQAGYSVSLLREPGGTRLSEKIRALLLDPQHQEMTGECELLLLEASRAQLVRQVIVPALERGDVVICDRFLDSTFAYQAGGRGLEEELVRRANELGCCGVTPDRTIVFDIDPTRAYGHSSVVQPDRMEAEGLHFQRRVRDAYVRLAAREPARVRLINGMGTLDVVYDRLVSELADLFPELREAR